jgi:tetratricopeptide (TPR) repeat protein
MGPPTWLFEKLPGATFEPSLFKGAELNIDIGFVVHDYINDGKDFLNEGLFFDAKISFDNALSRKPDSYDAWLGRAYSLEALKRYQFAVESYDTAIRYSDNEKYAYLAYAGKGRSSLENRNYQDAADAFVRAIELYPESADYDRDNLADCYAGLADALQNLGKTAESDEATRKAEDINATLPS